MLINYIKVISSFLVGISVLLVSSPTLGELFATMAPIYVKRESQILAGLGIPYEEISFPTSGGLVLRGWFFPADDPDAPAILYAPATAKDQRSGLSLAAPLHRAGYSVLLFSYRGHGLSDGNRFGFTYGAEESKDIDAAVSYLVESKGIKHVGGIGHSAGAVSLILSAARNPLIDALVTAAPFPSMEEIWYSNRPSYFPKLLFEMTFKLVELRKRFSRQEVRPQDVIKQIAPRPILLIHSNGDKRITQKQADALFDAGDEPKCLWTVESASHEEVRSIVLEEQVQNIITFFDQAFDNMAAAKCGNRYITSAG